MTCKHESAVDKYGECTFDMVGNIVYEVMFRECLDCGAWLPLGPSKDDGEFAEAVAIEVRAAELATAWEPIGGVGKLINGDEALGWNGWPYRQPKNSDEFAGFLAAQIRNHERDLGDVNWAGHHMADHELDARCIASHEEP